MDRSATELTVAVGPLFSLDCHRHLRIASDISTHMKTSAPGPLLLFRSEAQSGMPKITSAWIYGSWAERYHCEVGVIARDIDVLVVQ